MTFVSAPRSIASFMGVGPDEKTQVNRPQTFSVHQEAETTSVMAPIFSKESLSESKPADFMVLVVWVGLASAKMALANKKDAREDIKAYSERIVNSLLDAAVDMRQTADKVFSARIIQAGFQAAAGAISIAAVFAGPAMPIVQGASSIVGAGGTLADGFAEMYQQFGQATQLEHQSDQERARTSKEFAQQFLQENTGFFDSIVDFLQDAVRKHYVERTI